MEEKKLYLASQKGISSDKQSLSIRPDDFQPTMGQEIHPFLVQNASLASRGAELVEICKGILADNPQKKIVVFCDGRINGGVAARKALDESGLGCTWLSDTDTPKRICEKIGYYQNGDATEEDKKRPRVLVRVKAHCEQLFVLLVFVISHF